MSAVTVCIKEEKERGGEGLWGLNAGSDNYLNERGRGMGFSGEG